MPELASNLGDTFTFMVGFFQLLACSGSSGHLFFTSRHGGIRLIRCSAHHPLADPGKHPGVANSRAEPCHCPKPVRLLRSGRHFLGNCYGDRSHGRRIWSRQCFSCLPIGLSV